jgi:hypothetical protein
MTITSINPKTGAAIGYYETKGTTAEPFIVPMLWQPSSLGYVTAKADAGGNLSVVTGNPTITPNTPATYSVTNVSGTAVAANANRTSLVITNVGAVTVFFGLGVNAVLNSGIALLAGGSWTMDRYTFYAGAINAICASASTLAIQEFS